MPRALATAGIVWILLLSSCSEPPKQVEKPRPAPEPETRLVFGGDVMLSRHVGRVARQKGDPAWPFRDLAPFLEKADIAFVNLESPFSDKGRPVEKGMIFKADPAMSEGLKLAGIDVVSTANNHARDQGGYGLEYTLKLLDLCDIAAAGSGFTKQQAMDGAVLERNGIRFGFLAYTYDQSNGNHRDHDDRVAMLDVPSMQEAVKRLRTRADVVVVSMHAGIEYMPKPSESQVRFARAAVDAGAALVIGHHPHVIQPVEEYNEGVIFYSLGNLIFDQFQRKATQVGLLADVSFRGRKRVRYQTVRVDIRQTVPRLAGAEAP